MTVEISGLPQGTAEVARAVLARAYRHRAAQLVAAAQRLETASLDELAARPQPYFERSCRHLEDALDEALTAL